ncbi:TlpA family protein disulfide reductase [Methylomonas sp. HW2-6]|uniref:TlpA family protein disulfide reductase n=1 Tax=Methylomonas sp. HW2-6 TaxID=3376687 RepID=UPI0040418DD1
MTIRQIVFTFALVLGHIAYAPADQTPIKPFIPGSYQQILAANAGKPLMLAIWSVDCPSCLRDMAAINQLHDKHPALKIVMLAADEGDALPEIQRIVDTHKLGSMENWAFSGDNSEKLRYEIDPAWYGELPRTYFFDAGHQRYGKSGAMTLEEFEAQLAKMKI